MSSLWISLSYLGIFRRFRSSIFFCASKPCEVVFKRVFRPLTLCRHSVGNKKKKILSFCVFSSSSTVGFIYLHLCFWLINFSLNFSLTIKKESTLSL